MTKERCIEILKDLAHYIEDQWDENYIEDYPEGLEYAINTINSNKIIGELILNNKKYLIKGE